MIRRGWWWDVVPAAVVTAGGVLGAIPLVGVLARSVPIGVGVGLVWAGSLENIIGDGWSPGEQWFPGLVLRALVAPDAAAISTGRALATLAAYAVVAVGVTTIALRRRDVTS
jgi:ABC-2 type transport system permease protein